MDRKWLVPEYIQIRESEKNSATACQIHPTQSLSFIMPPKTSGKAAVKSGKATKAVTKGDKKKRKGKRKESYAIYIYKVLLIMIL